MSDKRSPRDHEQPLNAVAGVLAGKAVRELAEPLRELRERLAMALEIIERHTRDSFGPDPLPWKALQTLRQELADTYLLCRDTARVADELSDVVGCDPSDRQPHTIDINRHVEAALTLVRSRLSEHTELFVDLGSVPPVRAVPAELSLIVAKLLLCAADSAGTTPGSAVSVQTRYLVDQTPPVVLLAIADNGVGIPEAADAARRAIEPIMTELGGGFDSVSEPGQGSAFECWFPLVGADL